MLISYSQKLTLLSTILVALVLVSCGKEKHETAPPVVKGPYDNWKTYTYQNVRIVYPADHPQKDNLHDMAVSYVASINRDCQFLHIPVPVDTTVVIFYTGPGQGREMTPRHYPFAEGDTVYFWLPSYFGVTIMQWLIPKWQKEPPSFAFLRHGLLSLLDNSGQNYHVVTDGYLQNKSFIPLDSLAKDTTTNSDTERLQSGEAASFVDFIVYTYGIDQLDQLWLSKTSFDSSVVSLFNMSVDSLQTQWLGLVKEQAEKTPQQ